MQWPVYSLAEHASDIIRGFYNGVPDPDDPIPTPPSNNGNNNTNTGNNQSGALSSSTPSVLTSALVLLFAVAAIL